MHPAPTAPPVEVRKAIGKKPRGRIMEKALANDLALSAGKKASVWGPRV